MTRHHMVGQWVHILKKAVLHVNVVQSYPLHISACTEHVSANTTPQNAYFSDYYAQNVAQ